MQKITMRAARVNANYTQAETAEKLGVSKGTVSRWESGKSSPRVEQMSMLCKLYKITLGDVFLPFELPLS